MGPLAEAHAVWPKDRSFVASDGALISWTRVGDGTRTPVVFMNGWTCPDAYWKGIVPGVVEAGHPVVLFDTRGHGQSTLPARPGRTPRTIPVEHVSVTRVATDIVELLAEAELDRAVLAGHSMGVQGIFEAWRVGPRRIAGIVPIAGTYENPVPTFAEKEVLDKLFPIGDALLSRVPFGLLRPLMSQGHRMPPAMGMRLVGGLLRTGPTVTWGDIDPHVRQIGEVDFSIMWRMMSQMRSHSAADVLPTIDVPVLVLAGERDHFTPMSVQRRLAGLLPHPELVVFPDGGHLLPVEEAAGVTEALVEWLARRVDAGR